LVTLDRKHSEVSTTVCEYNKTDMAGKNPRKIHPELYIPDEGLFTGLFNASLWDILKNIKNVKKDPDCSSYGFH
jgi:hypothetical protein